MSASREKKQRQGSGQELTQKELKEAKEAQAAKRRTITYWVVGVVVAVLVIALLVWNSGIIDRNTAAATIGEKTISVSDMQYYYSLARINQTYSDSYMAQLGMAPQYDTSVPADQQVKDAESGQTWDAYFKEQAVNSAKRVVALVNAANAEGYKLSDEARAQVENEISALKDQVFKAGYSSFNGYLAASYGRYVTEGVYHRLEMDTALANEYYNSHSDSLTYTEEQLSAYAQENPATLNSYDFRYCVINGAAESTTDAEGNSVAPTDEEKAAAKANAKELADSMVSSVQSAAGDKSAAFNEFAVAAVGPDSPYADPEQNLQSKVMGSNLSGAAYYDWLTSGERKAGDVTAIESGDNYYVVLFLDSYLDNAGTADVRHILVKAELTQDDPATADVDETAFEPTQEQLDAAKAKADSILAEFQSGDKSEASFASLAGQYSEDGGSNTNGGLYTYMEAGSTVPEFDAWIFDPARQSGDTGVVANIEGDGGYYGYHVMYYVNSAGPKWHEVAQSTMKSDDMSAWIEGLESAYTVTEAGGMSKIGM